MKKDERLLLLVLIFGGLVLANRKKISSGAARLATQATTGTTTMVRAAINQFRDMTLPRGVRNNNPGNLRLTTIAWKGKVPNAQNSDRSFEQFIEYQGIPGHIWGIRAMFKDIYGDVFTKGDNTIQKLIYSYAPPHENATQAYVSAVSRAVGKAPTAMLTRDDMPKLVAAIIAHENAGYQYPATDITKAISLA